MVRQWQELFFERRYSEIDLSDNPDFVALAKAFGLNAFSINRADAVDDALKTLLDTPGPALLHVAIDTAANVWPLVPPNHNNAQMLDAHPNHAEAAPPRPTPSQPAARTTPDALPT